MKSSEIMCNSGDVAKAVRDERRREIATAAMQGLLFNRALYENNEYMVSSKAVKVADALIAELEK